MHNLDADAIGLDANDYVMAKNMAEALHRVYPNQLWAVTCEGKKGIATIRNMYLSGNYGFVLRLPTIYSGSDFERRVIMAGGEILERYRLKRGKFDQAQYANLPVDFAGHLTPDK